MTSSPKGNRVRQTGATKKCEFPLRHRASSREAHVHQREKLQPHSPFTTTQKGWSNSLTRVQRVRD